MRKTIRFAIFFLTAGLLAVQNGRAQGTLFVSNLGQTPTGGAAIGSDSWIAQSFVTGASSGSYTLNSIQLMMNPSSGDPNGFAVSIYAALGGAPQNQLGTLTGPDPAAGGILTYTASDIALSGGAGYFVVVTAATPIAQGAYNWSAANGVTRNGDWIINDSYYASADGSSWSGHARGDVFQMAIFATPAPEPDTLGLLALGGLFLASYW